MFRPAQLSVATGVALLAAGVLMGASSGCCANPSAQAGLPPGPEGIASWRRARAHVDALRERYRPDGAYGMNVMLELEQVQLGKRMRARGAVAVRPPDALRMILLGPGGTTALDLWVCGDAFRFAVPAIELERRGSLADAASPQLRGLPVAFLSWWFLRPFQGELLSVARDDVRGPRFVLRDGDDIVHLLDLQGGDGGLVVRRLSSGDEERLDVGGQRCGKVRYQQRLTGLDIQVACEKLNEGIPPARAFADPDAPERACPISPSHPISPARESKE
jgi:hypothetical protein